MRHSRARWNKLKQSGDSCGLRLLCFVGTRVGSLCQEQLRRFSTHGLRTLICGWRVPLGQQRRLDISFAWGYHRWGCLHCWILPWNPWILSYPNCFVNTNLAAKLLPCKTEVRHHGSCASRPSETHPRGVVLCRIIIDIMYCWYDSRLMNKIG